MNEVARVKSGVPVPAYERRGSKCHFWQAHDGASDVLAGTAAPLLCCCPVAALTESSRLKALF